MAIKARTKHPQIVTPVGTAKYPHVNTPNTRFNDEGDYSCDIIITKEEADALNLQFQPLFDAEYHAKLEELGKQKLKLSDPPVREDDDGNWVVKAKLKNVLAGVYKNGDPRPAKSIALYDSQGKPLKDTLVRGGSRVKLAVRPRFWYVASTGFGMSLDLLAVQVIELGDGGLSDKAAESFGFTEVEGGYVNGGESLEGALDAEEEEEDIIKADF
jgi:hypothetical protein